MDSSAAAILLFLALLPATHHLACAFDKFPKQFSFELPDSEEFCLYEAFDESAARERFTLSFRVVRGGNNDVDFAVKAPGGEKIYSKSRAHMDQREFKFRSGAYAFCFGNEFSTVTHKLVYFSLNRNRPESLAEEAGGPAATVPTVMTLLQTTMEAIHEHLARAEIAQSAYKAREVDGRAVCEDLNQRVMVLSAILAAAVLVCGFGQVAALKTLFADSKAAAGHGRHELL